VPVPFVAGPYQPPSAAYLGGILHIGHLSTEHDNVRSCPRRTLMDAQPIRRLARDARWGQPSWGLTRRPAYRALRADRMAAGRSPTRLRMILDDEPADRAARCAGGPDPRGSAHGSVAEEADGRLRSARASSLGAGGRSEAWHVSQRSRHARRRSLPTCRLDSRRRSLGSLKCCSMS